MEDLPPALKATLRWRAVQHRARIRLLTVTLCRPQLKALLSLIPRAVSNFVNVLFCDSRLADLM
jgi:hypothetical protein